MADNFSPKFGNLIKYTFVRKNLLVDQTKVDLNYADSQSAGSACVVPYDGSIVALSACVSGSLASNVLTAGSVTFYVHEDSTEVTAAAGLNVLISYTSGCSALGQSGYASQAPNLARVSAGDRLGVSVDTSGSMLFTGGTTGSANLKADLYVLLDPI